LSRPPGENFFQFRPQGPRSLYHVKSSKRGAPAARRPYCLIPWKQRKIRPAEMDARNQASRYYESFFPYRFPAPAPFRRSTYYTLYPALVSPPSVRGNPRSGGPALEGLNRKNRLRGASPSSFPRSYFFLFLFFSARRPPARPDLFLFRGKTTSLGDLGSAFRPPVFPFSLEPKARHPPQDFVNTKQRLQVGRKSPLSHLQPSTRRGIYLRPNTDRRNSKSALPFRNLILDLGPYRTVMKFFPMAIWKHEPPWDQPPPLPSVFLQFQPAPKAESD